MRGSRGWGLVGLEVHTVLTLKFVYYLNGKRTTPIICVGRY
jgi:hypothetical protein